MKATAPMEKWLSESRGISLQVLEELLQLEPSKISLLQRE